MFPLSLILAATLLIGEGNYLSRARLSGSIGMNPEMDSLVDSNPCARGPPCEANRNGRARHTRRGRESE